MLKNRPIQIAVNGRVFAPFLWAWALFFVGLLGFIALGNWQLNRAAEVDTQLALRTEANLAGAVDFKQLPISPTQALYRRVVLQGEWLQGRDIIQDNVTYSGQSGFHVITPFMLTDNLIVLVDRGWKAWGKQGRQLPSLPALPVGRVELMGESALPLRRFVLGDDIVEAVWPRLVQRLDTTQVQAWLGMPVASMIVRLQSENKQGLVQQWDIYGNPDKHRAYATQWFLFGFALCIFFVVLNLRKKNNQ